MAKNTVKLKKYLDIIEEYVASGTITPGMLLEYDSDGKVKAHSTADGTAIPMFALEDELQGNGLSDNYSADDQVQVWVAQRGEQAYAMLADNENIAIGDFLVSNGAGRLQKVTANSSTADMAASHIVAQALEAIDLSGSSGTYPDEYPRIKVRVV